MSKTLVAYFSASRTTAGVAKDLASDIHADLYEIRPAVPYTQADLNWMDKKSRSSVEPTKPAAPSFRTPMPTSVLMHND